MLLQSKKQLSLLMLETIESITLCYSMTNLYGLLCKHFRFCSKPRTVFYAHILFLVLLFIHSFYNCLSPHNKVKWSRKSLARPKINKVWTTFRYAQLYENGKITLICALKSPSIEISVNFFLWLSISFYPSANFQAFLLLIWNNLVS